MDTHKIAQVEKPQAQDATQKRLEDLEAAARDQFKLGQYNESEVLYKQLIDARVEIEGPESNTNRDKYNLCQPLINQSKYAEAEAVLRDIIPKTPLQPGEKKFQIFAQQEIGMRRMLMEALGSQGKLDEAKGELGAAFKLADMLEGTSKETHLKGLIDVANRVDPSLVASLLKE